MHFQEGIISSFSKLITSMVVPLVGLLAFQHWKRHEDSDGHVI